MRRLATALRASWDSASAPISRAIPNGLALAMACSVLVATRADAAVLLPWQQWAGSPAAVDLVIVPGAADFTGDGRIDIMVYKTGARKLWVGRSTGSAFAFCAAGGAACIGTETEAWATVTTGCPSSLQFYTGQFASNSRPDVVVYDPCTGELRILVNLGTTGGITGPFATVDPIGGWTLIAGDFVGDALTDVMVYYEGDGSIFVGRNAILGFVWQLWGGVERGDTSGGAPPWQFQPGQFAGDAKLDILAYRPGSQPFTLGRNTRIGINTGSGFAMSSWFDLPISNVTPVVANWTGTPTADVGIRTNGLPFDFGETHPDFMVFRNGEGTLLESLNWTNLVPEDDNWRFEGGDFITAGDSAGLPDLFAYYPGDGTFWVAENRGAPPEGYAWPLSVAPGESIQLYTSGALRSGQPNVVFERISADPSGTVVAEASPTASLTAVSAYQPILADGAIPRNGPQWSPNIAFTIPSDWPTGIYAATLKARSGPDFRISFVVEPPPGARHRTALLANINTWNAYNPWGETPGMPGYKYNGAALTTFMRPSPWSAPFVGSSLPPFPGTHLGHAEIWALAALESMDGLGRGQIDLYTDLDFHDGVVQAGPSPGQYDRLILTTHPEYWTTQMYDNLRTFLDRGGDLLYLGGNGLFEVTTYTPAPLGGLALSFYAGIEGGNGQPPHRVPYLFRVIDAVGGVAPRPERALLGVATWDCIALSLSVPYAVKPHPPLGTPARLVFDTLLEGVVSPADAGPDRHIGTMGVHAMASGHEIDKVDIDVDGDGYVASPLRCTFPNPLFDGYVEPNTTPAGLVWLAEGLGGGADITFYTYPDPPGPDPGGGYVFSVGSINFGQSLFVDPFLKRLVQNVICCPEPGLGLGLGVGVLALGWRRGRRTLNARAAGS